MTAKKRPKSKTAPSPASKDGDVSCVPRLPRSREALGLLLQRAAAVLEFLHKSQLVHEECLKTLEGAITRPYSVLERRAFMADVAAASMRNFAAGGPEMSPLMPYMDRHHWQVVMGRFNQARKTVRSTLSLLSGGNWNQAKIRIYAAAMRALVTAHDDVAGIFRSLQNRIMSTLEEAADKTDRRTDKPDSDRPLSPQNGDVTELARRIRKAGRGETKKAVALDFTEGNEKYAQSLLRELRRYPNLLPPKGC
jgi:hypothetical protein